ncbi:hypothetical protein SGLAM104S_10683 [Streptomyces glaucescens]
MSPFMSISAPPELPGLRDASVWMALYVVVDEPVSPLNSRPPNSNGQPPPGCCCCCPSSVGTVTSRSSAETMPLVTVPVRPSGEPMATTWSPTRTAEESPRVAAGSPEAFSSWIRARSLPLSVPTVRAVYSLPSLVVTVIREAPETTWLLVMISPSPVMITPEPVEVPAPEVALISTMLGPTASATPATVPFWPAGTTAVPVEPAATVEEPSVSSWMPVGQCLRRRPPRPRSRRR